jgi:glucosylceramidase
MSDVATKIIKAGLKIEVFETSRYGGNLNRVSQSQIALWAQNDEEGSVELVLLPDCERQTITGFGGSFTDATSYLVHQMSPSKRQALIQAYFSAEGANYSLTRTHMNSCDFSRRQYSYAPVAGDKNLTHFDIEHDRDYLIPMIKAALKCSEDGFKLIASPWTAPPWMKDNNSWVGGNLLPEYSLTWAKFFAKYAHAYAKEGIPLWGFTVENEPHGNGGNWESMHFSPEQMTAFVRDHLGPVLAESGLEHLKILGYDQNREGLDQWVSVMYQNPKNGQYFDGTAVHWYESTYDYFPEALERAHNAAPNKYLIQTEACCDAQIPVWDDDDWYWREEATDWGYTWREPEKKYLHPKYAPAHRYARDIIGCLNHWVDGWIDWNMVLDRQGGPNWFENWCVAPVLVDPDQDAIYFTPLYYVMCHFSKFIRPGFVVIQHSCADQDIMATAIKAHENSFVVVLFNPTKESKHIQIKVIDQIYRVDLTPQAIQTIIINN